MINDLNHQTNINSKNTNHFINTVAAVVEQNGKFLIIEEYSRDGKAVFNQPAGHVEKDETLLEAVVRETMEEAGHIFTPNYFLGCFTYLPNEQTTPYKRFAFVGNALAQPHAKLDKGIIAAHWLTYNELLQNQDKLRSHLVLKTLDVYLSGQKFDLNGAQQFL